LQPEQKFPDSQCRMTIYTPLLLALPCTDQLSHLLYVWRWISICNPLDVFPKGSDTMLYVLFICSASISASIASAHLGFFKASSTFVCIFIFSISFKKAWCYGSSLCVETYCVMTYLTLPLREYLSGGFPWFCLGGKK